MSKKYQKCMVCGNNMCRYVSPEGDAPCCICSNNPIHNEGICSGCKEWRKIGSDHLCHNCKTDYRTCLGWDAINHQAKLLGMVLKITECTAYIPSSTTQEER